MLFVDLIFRKLYAPEIFQFKKWHKIYIFGYKFYKIKRNQIIIKIITFFVFCVWLKYQKNIMRFMTIYYLNMSSSNHVSDYFASTQSIFLIIFYCLMYSFWSSFLFHIHVFNCFWIIQYTFKYSFDKKFNRFKDLLFVVSNIFRVQLHFYIR